MSKKRAENKKTIIFEEVFPVHEWGIKWYVFRKREIYFIRLNRRSKRRKWVKNFLKTGRMKKIELNLKLHSFDGVYYDKAFDNIDYFYQTERENSLVRQCTKLYENDNINLGFKKILSEKLARFYYLNEVFYRIQSVFKANRILFVPAIGNVLFYLTDGCEILDFFKFSKLANRNKIDCRNIEFIKFPFWTKAVSYTNVFKRKATIFLQLLGVLLFIFAKSIKKLFIKDKAAYYKFAIMIISQSRQFAKKIQKVDFLIDDEMIKKRDTLFISRTKLKDENKRYMKENCLNYLDQLDKYISLKEISEIAHLYFLLLIKFFNENSLFLSTGLKMIYFYLRWKSFTRNIKIENLITRCDFGLQSIARNIILEREGCKTYYYIDSTNFGYAYTRTDENAMYRFSGYGFIYYDYLISWSDSNSKYFKDSKCNIKNYSNLGCFWAEHLRLIEEGKIASDFKKRLYEHGYDGRMKVVTVFDSGLHDDFVTTYEDGIRFLEGISRILDDLPNVFVVIKEKQPRSHHRKLSDRFESILRVYERLEKHKRCYSIKNSWENSSEVMAFSHLVISFPFTSPTVEALSAGKKAIWYDPTSKFRGVFYDNINGLVCHGYPELLDRVRDLLFNISEKDYAEYLNNSIKNRIENYIDGKAITRFREQLVNKK